MDVRITFRGMEHSSVMEEYAQGQLAKIKEFLSEERSPVSIELVFEPSKLREHHRIELRVKSPNYQAYTDYEHQGMDFYDVLDRVIDTMYLKLREEKQKNVDKRKTVGRHDEFKKQR